MSSPSSTRATYDEKECNGNYKSLTSKDAITLVENKYKFTVKGAVNYIFSRALTNPDHPNPLLRDKMIRRELMFEGALNLHEIVTFIPSFAENYVELGKEEYIYMFHVIFDQSYECISKFVGYESREKRQEEMRVQLLRIIDFFECVFGVFLNEKCKQKNKYRNDTPFEVLERAYAEFQTVVLPELKREYNI